MGAEVIPMKALTIILFNKYHPHIDGSSSHFLYLVFPYFRLCNITVYNCGGYLHYQEGFNLMKAFFKERRKNPKFGTI